MAKCLELFKLTIDILLATTLRNFPFGISEIEKYKVCVSDKTKFTPESLDFNRIHKLSCEKVIPSEVYCDMASQKFTHVRTLFWSTMLTACSCLNAKSSSLIWFFLIATFRLICEYEFEVKNKFFLSPTIDLRSLQSFSKWQTQLYGGKNSGVPLCWGEN